MAETKGFIGQAFTNFGRHHDTILAAAFAYYAVFSIAPMLVIIIAVVSLIYGEAAAQGQIVGQISGIVGQDAAGYIQTLIASTSKSGGSLPASLIGLGTLLLSATTLIAQLRTSLDIIWETEETSGIKAQAKERLLSLGVILLIGLLFVILLFVNAALPILLRLLPDILPGQALSKALEYGLSIGTMAVLFAVIFKILPRAHVPWSAALTGALATAVLFTVGRIAIGAYLSSKNVGQAYGSAGAAILVLLWIYYSALALFLGAEFTRLWSKRKV